MSRGHTVVAELQRSHAVCTLTGAEQLRSIEIHLPGAEATQHEHRVRVHNTGNDMGVTLRDTLGTRLHNGVMRHQPESAINPV